MAVINTNILSLQGQQNQHRANNSLATAMERLSSGLRVNSAKDDSAGQAIGNRMTAQIRGHAQAMRNANDGVSLIQTAQGGLDQINSNLQRVRELTVQGLNGTLSAIDKQTILDEIQSNFNEIDRLTGSTSFNGIPLLNGHGEVMIQVGANDGQSLPIDLSPPGFTVEELGLGSFGLEGGQSIVGDPIEVNLNDPAVTVNFGHLGNNGDTHLIENNGQLYVVDMSSSSPSLYRAGNYYATHNSTTNETTVDVEVLELIYEDVNSISLTNNIDGYTFFTLGGSQLPSSGFTYEALVDDEGRLYVSVYDQNTSQTTYYRAEVDFAINNLGSISVEVMQSNEVDISDIGNLSSMNTLPILDYGDSVFKHISINNSITDDFLLKENSSSEFVAQTFNSDTLSFYTIDTSQGYIREDGSTRNMLFRSNSASFLTLDLQNDRVSEVSAYTIEDESDFHPLKAIDDAIALIDSKRGYLGATENRLSSVIDNLTVTNQNLIEARSRILDANYAVEVANMTKAQILQQASTSVLAQANQVPQAVLSLLN